MIGGNAGDTGAFASRYTPWIARLEVAARSDASAYRRKVIAAGLAGYLALAGLIALPVAALAWGVVAMLPVGGAMRVISFVLLTGALLYFSFRLPRVPPAGIVVVAAQAPALFVAVERLRHLLAAPPVHEVRICAGMNAGLLQHLRFGRAATRNILLLGLPVFFGLTAREVEAVIAHELAHAVGAHNLTAAFVDSVRSRMGRTGERLPDSRLGRLLRPLFGWYVGWFTALSTVLIRQHEFDADRAATAVVRPAAMSSALRRFVIKSLRFDQHLSQRMDQAARRGATGATALRRALADLAYGFQNDVDIVPLVDEQEPEFSDTHPPLRQRLAAIGGGEVLLPTYGELPGTALLGSAADALVETIGNRFYAPQHRAEDRDRRDTT